MTKDTYEDFKSRNTESIELTDKFNLDVKVNLINKESDDNWSALKEKYPTAVAIIYLSRVGFNREKTQALISVSYHCSAKCAGGYYVLLIKKDKDWQIQRTAMTWIS